MYRLQDIIKEELLNEWDPIQALLNYKPKERSEQEKRFIAWLDKQKRIEKQKKAFKKKYPNLAREENPFSPEQIQATDEIEKRLLIKNRIVRSKFQKVLEDLKNSPFKVNNQERESLFPQIDAELKRKETQIPEMFGEFFSRDISYGVLKQRTKEHNQRLEEIKAIVKDFYHEELEKAKQINLVNLKTLMDRATRFVDVLKRAHFKSDRDKQKFISIAKNKLQRRTYYYLETFEEIKTNEDHRKLYSEIDKLKNDLQTAKRQYNELIRLGFAVGGLRNNNPDKTVFKDDTIPPPKDFKEKDN